MITEVILQTQAEPVSELTITVCVCVCVCVDLISLYLQVFLHQVYL